MGAVEFAGDGRSEVVAEYRGLEAKSIVDAAFLLARLEQVAVLGMSEAAADYIPGIADLFWYEHGKKGVIYQARPDATGGAAVLALAFADLDGETFDSVVRRGQSRVE